MLFLKKETGSPFVSHPLARLGASIFFFDAYAQHPTPIIVNSPKAFTCFLLSRRGFFTSDSIDSMFSRYSHVVSEDWQDTVFPRSTWLPSFDYHRMAEITSKVSILGVLPCPFWLVFSSSVRFVLAHASSAQIASSFLQNRRVLAFPRNKLPPWLVCHQLGPLFD
mmetsp:Transcript_47325/g.125674  ORF Transcript_47325/g.125674 Transcript_47325/m.125674 type:complete len:165 (+) Transcript_47325:69-563(+)